VKKIAIVGAGISGFSFAYHLGKGFKIDVCEELANVGGLAQRLNRKDTNLEVFFHHFSKANSDLINLM
jgi:protoporphyrinogen oxidase